ncbi:MAG: DNA mismatch repair protein MutS [Methanothrix sp.]|nr:DNA mismatch repair protein MutS [Methanothrix sp.]
MKLTDLPGVGPRTSERLREHYGGEERALEAILQADLVGLSKVLGERQAILLVQNARGMRYGASPDLFLATDEALRVYRMLISRLVSYAHTDYARYRISALFPSSSPELLAENQSYTRDAIERARRVQGMDLDSLLMRVRPLAESPAKRVRGRAVVATSPEDFQRLKANGVDGLIDLFLAETRGEVAEVASGYSHVTLFGDVGEGHPNVEPAVSEELWYLVPEAVLGFYEENLEAIQAAVEAARRLNEAGVAGFPGLDDLAGLIARLASREDRELARLVRLAGDIRDAMGDAVSWANEELRRRIEGSSITLDGTDLLQFIGRDEGFRELFELQMRGVFQEVMKEARDRAAARLGMEGTEALWLEEILSQEISYPLELDRKALGAFEQDLRTRIEARTLRSSRDLARELQGRRGVVEGLLRALMEFDFAYALGSFSIKEGLCMPQFVEVPCLYFEEGRNLFLERPDPVSYALGSPEHPERVVLLSGVNSGGKTSLLDLIAQIVVLAHMGLPVPAERCHICLFQEIYYFSKSRGTLSAGAFESAMRKFAVVENQRLKIILADELEAITEPGASARIIACMLDELNRRSSVAVFVSHLAEEVRRLCQSSVRVDGIEASGLDEESNLIVNRSPRYSFLARSTPELILDRLVRTTEGPEREFYARLLSKFR